MQKYVLAFVYNKGKDKVALIRKDRPVSQAGKLNGIGGKVEDGEDPIEAIHRELREETTVDVPMENLMYFASFGGDWGKVYCFTAVVDDSMLYEMRCPPPETESIEVHDILKLNHDELVDGVEKLIKESR